MKLDKEIARQIARIEGLRAEVFERKPDARDAKRPEAMRRDRAVNIRKAVNDLRKRREATIARIDTEIADLEAELKTLEAGSKVDIGAVRAGGEKTKKGSIRPAAAKATKRSPTGKKSTRK